MRVAVHGYLGSAVGVGEAARRGIRALAGQGVEIQAHAIALDGRDTASPLDWATPTASPRRGGRADAELLYVNPEALPRLLAELGPRQVGVRRVGIWSWESDVVPQGWIAAARELDEVWTYSRVSAGILGAALATPVIVMPIPVTCAPALPPPALPRGGPRLLCVFDHLSTLERKNPIGAIQAFARAFSDGEGPQLVVKTMGARHRPRAHQRLLDAAGERGDVVVFDGALAAGALVGLIVSSAAFVSLHRSEGFGLLPAEAALLGIPVLATGFGGILDFLDDQSAWLVDHSLVEVGEGVEHYPPAGTWAEPDLDHAAAGLREIIEDPQEAAKRAVRAQARITDHFGVEAIGSRMLDRLTCDCRRAKRPAQPAHPAVPALRLPVIVGVPFRGEHELAPTLRALDEHTPPHVPVLVACGDADSEAAAAARSSTGSPRVELLVGGGETPTWSQLLAILIAGGSGDLALVAPGVGVGHGWLEGLIAAAHDDTVASASALVLHGPGGGRTARRVGAAAPAPAAAPLLARAGSRLRPELSFASSRCVLLRRPALALLGELDLEWGEPGQVLAEFGARAVSVGLRNHVADDVLVADTDPRLKGFWPPDEESARFPQGGPAVPGRIRAVDRGVALERSIDRARWLTDGPDVTVDARAIADGGGEVEADAFQLIRVLADSGAGRLRIVTGPRLSARERDRLAGLPGVELLADHEVSRAVHPSPIIHRPTPVSTPTDLTLLRRLGRRLVLTVPDLIEYRIADYHTDHADWTAHRRLTRAALAAADLTLAFSDWVRRDILAEGIVGHERVRVVSVGDDRATDETSDVGVAEPEGLRDLRGPFLVFLGSDRAHENRPLALRLLAELRDHHGWNGSLVLAGARVGHGSSRAAEERVLAAHPELAPFVRILERVSAAERNWLLAHARAVVHPSVAEGSCRLPVECARAGCPCLFAAVAALAEACGSAATLVPWDAVAWAARVRPLLDPGPERAAHLAQLTAATRSASWSQVAEEMHRAYEHAMGLPYASGRPEAQEEAAREALVARLRESDAHHRSVAQEYQDALHALEARIGDGLPLAERDGVLSDAERRGLIAVASRRPWGSPVLGPLAALGNLVARRDALARWRRR